jgi:ASC-1-like (ASCH) protein
MKIEKKIWPEFFEKIKKGVKTCELRLGDAEYKPGDIIVLKEFDPKKGKFTGRSIEKEVTDVINTNEIKFWPKEMIDKYGFAVISFK